MNSPDADRWSGQQAPDTPSRGPRENAFARLIGRSRIVVVVAVVAVLISAFSLFLLGAVLAGQTVWSTWGEATSGHLQGADLTVRFLEVVSVMLKAVIFYLIGVGLYSLFISPLNVTVALGVETLGDLETKIISVVIVIMAVRFLEWFIEGMPAVELLTRAGALAAVVAALVLFKWHTHVEGRELRASRPADQEQAKRDMFRAEHEQHASGHDHAPPPAPDERRSGAHEG